MKLGFLGTGAITAAIINGLSSAGGRYEICVSPRNSAIAADLAGRFSNVSIAAGNQELLDACETVVIAVRPQITEALLTGLRFRADHNAISVVSGFNVERLRGLVAPARQITRAVPLPAAARRRSPTAIYPRNPEVVALFSQVGEAFAVDTEPAFDAFCATTATMANYFALAATTADWLTRHEIDSQQARDYVAQIFGGLAESSLRFPEKSFADLAADHATKGGTNEQVLRQMTAAGVFETYSHALDGILRRVTGEPPIERVQPVE